MLKRNNFSVINLYFIGSFVCLVFFLVWITASTLDEKVSHVSQVFNDHIRQGKIKEAEEFLYQSLGVGTEAPLDIVWLPLVERVNGYIQLELYERILKAHPKNERVYEGISYLFITAPEMFDQQLRQDYIEALKKIKGVDESLLRKYRLVKQD